MSNTPSHICKNLTLSPLVTGEFNVIGTCSVRIVDWPVGEQITKEQARIAISTHDDADDIRLVYKYRVTDDVTIERACGVPTGMDNKHHELETDAD